MLMEEQELTQKMLLRDKHALSVFYRRYAPKLSRFIAVKIASTHDAEEVLQDTLFAFLEALRDFQGASKLETFLFAICQHKIIDYYRRKKLKHLVFSRTPYLEDIISPLLNPEEELDASELKRRLKHTFGSIMPKYRKILELKYMEGLSVADIARQFRWTIKATESLLFRARKSFVGVFESV